MANAKKDYFELGRYPDFLGKKGTDGFFFEMLERSNLKINSFKTHSLAVKNKQKSSVH